jgi:signal peptidase I
MSEESTDQLDTVSAPEGEESQPKRSRWLVETLVIVAVAIVVAVVLRTFVVGTFSIPSGSMEPTLNINDRILVDKLAYHFHSVHTGDVVVFTTPADEHCAGAPVKDLVKRVVGLPGQTVSLSDGQVYINSKLLSQTWLPAAVRHQTYPGPTGTKYSLAKPFHIPAHDVYVMGDNRTASCDSRYWGPINESTIVGKVDIRFWPLSRFKFF